MPRASTRWPIGYRQQLGAQFCIVTDPTGRWIGSPGWPGDSAAASSLETKIVAARNGRAGRHIVALNDRLFLLIVEPVRFADEVLGTFAVGYALDDGVARQLAQATHCEVNLVAGHRLSGSSFGAAERTELERWLRRPDASTVGPVSANGLWPLGQSRYVAGMFPLTMDVGDGRSDRLILFQSWGATQQFLDGLRAQFLVAGFLIFVVTLVGGLVFSRRTSQPLRDVAAAARDIATGDWERQVPLRGTAEATTLAEAFNDMSASLRQAHARLLHDAFHDHLTQLPNRALFLDRLQQAVARRARRSDYLFAVLFIDLDRFKTVNESIGHSAGDRLLLEVSSRLTAVLRSNDTVARPNVEPVIDPNSNTLARVGGDEFTILLEDIQDPSDAVRIAERLHQAVALPFDVEGHTIFPSASIGIAVSSPMHGTGDDLIRDADIAMYRAKSSGGAQCAIFDTTMHRSAVERLQLETDMRHALESDGFRLFYQPIVSIAENRIVGFEALIRWQHPTRGLLAPAAFLRVAEETGLVTRLDSWVLRNACRDARRWQLETPTESPLSLSVNISAQGFGRPDLVTQVADALRETGLDPHALRLEITETVAMSDAERARMVLGGAEVARRAHQPRRFRNRLFVAELPAALPGGYAEDRPVLRRRHGRERRMPGDHPDRAEPGDDARTRSDRRRRRDRNADQVSRVARLQVRPGLLLFASRPRRSGAASASDCDVTQHTATAAPARRRPRFTRRLSEPVVSAVHVDRVR